MNLRRLVQIAPLLLLIAACSKNPLPLTQPEKQTMTELTASLKTRCVGRYLIDMPSDALSTGSATIQGVTFEATSMTNETFEQEMTARETELKSKVNRHGYRVLYDYGQISNTPHSRYFVALRDVDDTADLSRAIEAYKWDAGYQLKLRIEASDWVHSEYKKKVQGTPYAVPDMSLNDVPEKTNLVMDLIRKVRGRADDEIPAEPGVCFLGGFLPRKAANGEDISVLFAMKDRTDAFFTLQTNTDLRELPRDTLLNRLPDIRSKIKDPNANGRIIRSGTVQVGGIKAEELLLSGTTTARIAGHVFTLEANTATSGSMTPYLVLDMGNGSINTFARNGIQKASLTDGEAIALWDTVSRTLRPRPNGF
ncbi:T6SS immunity protein Tli4 family protein [Caballeronia humi]|uniref:Lipoprotein n=1 Tax=Caballeronia humi TaxID=326474 RepID=A0A158GNW3_9BURK|nr:T6SS immunity protein Tli4 family protein [Caballeronia humi]SAL33090.1 putative lipoprotein [Caballeronia humi]